MPLEGQLFRQKGGRRKKLPINMSMFFWNVRGLNKTTKHPVVKDWVRSNGFQVGCILETRVKQYKAMKIASAIFPDWSTATNYEFSPLGRIWVVWKQGVSVIPLFKSKQVITCSVKMDNKADEFFCSFIYALNTVEERKELWADLKNHHQSVVSHQKPWLCMGDFNEVLSADEHSNQDSSSLYWPGMTDFQEMTRLCALEDMPGHGPLFTWTNKREEGVISKKLDRALKNSAWDMLFPHSYSVFEAGGCSDHLRCRLQLEPTQYPKQKPFKFNNAMRLLEEFQPLVEKHWKESAPLRLSTSALFQFSKKLKALKPSLKALSNTKLNKLSQKAEEAYRVLCNKQERNLNSPSPHHMQDENEAYRRWDHVSRLEEVFLKQRSKLHWLKVGDGNNKAFHIGVSNRNKHNTIREVKCRDGRVVDTVEEIKTEAEGFFKDFLQFIPPDYTGATIAELDSLLPSRCSVEDQQQLEKEVTTEEIQKVLFSMPNNKSPGPDGFNSEFYKEVWPLIGTDFITAVKSFFVKGFLPKGMNSTILALLPKTTSALEIKDYRPISCCNVIYKVISKIIANRLKGILPHLISTNQSAFVKDRLLIENLLLATELVRDYHKDSISSRCAIKIDIAKAFDSVQWSFLLNTLRALNFPEKVIHWISLCITTASFSVQINGELAGYFQSNRGLRQGCSLSPYLFVIAMNVLSKMLDKDAQQRQTGYHPNCKNLGLTHLSFADDILVFTDGKIRSIDQIIDTFEKFSRMSGLSISLEKSTIYLAGIPTAALDDIKNKFSLTLGELPVRYLGLPLLPRKMTATDYRPLLDKIRSKLTSWTARFLSLAGRLQLLNSVISNISNFWLSAFRLPKGCIREIDKLCSSFLWSGPAMNSKKSKMKWSDLCSPKDEGGLGIKPLVEVNNVFCLKLIWRIITGHSSLWVQWIHNNLIRRANFWNIQSSTTLGSWMWRKILKGRDLARAFHKVKIGNGESTSFWFDKWSEFGCIHDLLGARGVVDLGIPLSATVAEAWSNRRRRRHRTEILSNIEQAISSLRLSSVVDADISLWRSKGDKFRDLFNSKNTWLLARQPAPKVLWTGGIWFKHATPKFSMFAWLAVKNRLTTGERMSHWNVGANTSCVFCRFPMETIQHLFFSCPYSSEIWAFATSGLLNIHFTTDWGIILTQIGGNHLDNVSQFLLRYIFQASIHILWRERNSRRHGEAPTASLVIQKVIDKQVRNRCSTIEDYRLDASLQRWFSIRRFSAQH